MCLLVECKIVPCIMFAVQVQNGADCVFVGRVQNSAMCVFVDRVVQNSAVYVCVGRVQNSAVYLIVGRVQNDAVYFFVGRLQYSTIYGCVCCSSAHSVLVEPVSCKCKAEAICLMALQTTGRCLMVVCTTKTYL